MACGVSLKWVFNKFILNISDQSVWVTVSDHQRVPLQITKLTRIFVFHLLVLILVLASILKSMQSLIIMSLYNVARSSPCNPIDWGTTKLE